MLKFSDVIFGVPVSRARVRAEVETFIRTRDVHTVRGILNENLSHITAKSGALLQAQGIFIVVATYALDEGWPRSLALSTLLLLIASALAVITNLRTVFIGLNAEGADDRLAEVANVVRTAEIASWRGALFNIALYLTFLAILLLGIAAILFEQNR